LKLETQKEKKAQIQNKCFVVKFLFSSIQKTTLKESQQTTN